MANQINQKIKLRYNRAKKYHKPFEVVAETFTCVYKDNGDPQYALDRYDWVVTVVDSFENRGEAESFMTTLGDMQVF